MPQIADWDEDGDLDLLVGERNGYVWLFLNNGSTTIPTLTAAGRLTANSAIINVGTNSCPVIADWNNDKKKDLIIGNETGQIRVYLNTGTNSSPTFGSYSAVANVSYYRGSPEIVDLNGDGKKDLIVGDNAGYVYYHENIGGDASPAFASGGGVRLRTKDGSYIKVYSGAHIDAADWDADGNIDILVGDFYGYNEVFINTETGSNIKNPNADLPRDFSLSQNYPNPFNARTTISYKISKPQLVNLSVYNGRGQLVKTLVNESQPAGEYSIDWDASGIPSGIYIYQITAESFSDVKKCALLK